MKEIMYFAPSRVDEALKILAEHREKVTILAGGTDIVPRMNYYDVEPDILLYIGGLGLNYLKVEEGKLVIGSTTTWSKLACDSLVAEKASVLSEAARHGGSIAIRNAGTIGGNLANASPAADLATPLMVMDAELLLASAKGERIVSVTDFFTGPGETVLKPDELIIEIRVPALAKSKTAFLKLGRRRAMTLSVVNVAVRLDTEDGTCHDARIALGSMAPTPIRCVKAEEKLKGKSVDKGLINECAEQAVAESNPIDDQRATAWYRRKAGKALVSRAIAQAAGLTTLL